MNPVDVITRFEAWCEKTPDAVAARFSGEDLTYAELNRRANRLAHRLVESGVGPDSVVGLCVERSLHLPVGVLGILKAGAAYLPLDPNYPAQRLAFMVEDARVNVLVTTRGLHLGWASGPSQDGEDGHPTSIHLDDGWNDSPETAPPRSIEADHLAYAIYTSGSTGTPKGVAMIHGALANLIEWQLDDSAIGPNQRTLQFAPLSFDVSFQELFATWCAGGNLVLIPEELRLDTPGLLGLIASDNIERLFLPFIALQTLADTAIEQDMVPTSLREVITAGEQLQSTPSIIRFFEQAEGCSLSNHYGPSETHVATAHRLQGPPADWPALPPIGRPLPNVTIRILEDSGELCLGGAALARGYLYRPELTAERFAEIDGERFYHTGDLARTDANGELEFLGRMDHQVKVRGFRIELG
ncbi:MAG: amino acid adenylation domain-containing protein, partial [Verrucomicrobiota bacterium]